MSLKNKPRVAIIGAGPSGLTLAYYLKALGLESVQFFEALGEVGGQSVTHDVEGFPVEMGTVYLTDGYVLAKRIAEGVGCPATRLPPATVLNPDGSIRPSLDHPPKRLVLRYLWHWLKWYLGGQMRVPDHPDNAKTFEQWLVDRGLGDLATSFIFTAGLTAQLYGPIKDITAHNGLNWMRPSLLYTGKHEDTASILKGFQTMWKALQKELGFPVKFHTRIDTVRPISVGGGHQVELLASGEQVDEPFDHVFIACPLDFLEDHPLDAGNDLPGTSGLEASEGSPLKRLEHPLSDALAKADYGPFDTTEVYSGAWVADKESWRSKEAPSRCYLPAASTGDRGRLLTIRKYGETDKLAVGQFCSYAYPSELPDDDPKRLQENAERLERNKRTVVQDMEDIVKLTGVEIRHQRLWRYSIRYSSGQILKGLPGLVHKSQGEQNVWYAGATLSHWDVDAITDDSLVLVKRFAKKIGVPYLTRFSRLFRFANLIADF